MFGLVSAWAEQPILGSDEIEENSKSSWKDSVNGYLTI